MRYGRALLEVEKPGRYEGLEVGALVKDWESARLRVVLCFPDVYEIGVSHQGLPILYHALNGMEGVLAERAYAPWMDMEALLTRRGWPLVTRETGRPLRDFDWVGFTLQYELAATNVLCMLERGGVPILARDRSETDPLVIGGGPVAANPEPLADFFDAFFLGEAEDGVREMAAALAAAKGDGRDRRGRLEALGTVPGVYLPDTFAPRYEAGRFAGFAGNPPAVRSRTLPNLDRPGVAQRPIVPFIGAVHDRLAVELARGCTRGCRFCQAGFLYRPVRERSPETVQRTLREGLACSGFDEVGLLSLSTGDYSSIGPLLVALMDEHAGGRVAVSLPSLRVDSLDERLLAEVSRVRKTGFTVAPEAGSQRLRRVINKNITEADVLAAAEKIFAAGWKAVKLYFMIGLPTETRADWEGIVDLVQAVARIAPQGRGRVSASISNFVPKPHTPFQWCRQIDADAVREAQEFFKSRLRHKKIDLKWHDARMSVLEGILARGDRRLGEVIAKAYRDGCRMDGWTSEFRWERWAGALTEQGLVPDDFLRERRLDEPLPWDGVDGGVDRTFLVQEWDKARREEATGDCRDGTCRGCGLCDFQLLMPRIGDPRDYPRCLGTGAAPPPAEESPRLPRVRFRFAKTGAGSLLSHLETVAALHRALRACAVDLAYSQGFHPHPKLILGPALPMGTESLVELGEMRVATIPDLRCLAESSAAQLPEGLRIDALWVLDDETPSLTGGGVVEVYLLTPTPAAARSAASSGGWSEVIREFWDLPTLPVVKQRKNKPDRVLEAKALVTGLRCEDGHLEVTLRRERDGTSVAPEGFLHTLLGLPAAERACERILKVRQRFL